MENIIYKYFPNLTEDQRAKFDALESLYRDWNSKINVISRKDMDSFYLHHVLHSLAISKMISFSDGATVLDVGTGGGFPGIPLAILFPNVEFTLCDSIGKKIKVVEGVATSLGLKNVKWVNARVETLPQKFDYIVSRAVTDLSNFIPWVKNSYKNGIIYLKGGDLKEEIEGCCRAKMVEKDKIMIFNIQDWFTEEFFESKKVIFIAR
ncbi:MAG: 16S rRNA (guanine(527)-N(7))-methyltransferase RsmG [Bacteroidales bacterium]|nr:16S rRNA (guanine(527)-N(7))-methyltransferase RsmG [Bacteroidales bacterium]